MERSTAAALRDIGPLLAAIDPLKVWAIVATLCAIMLALIIALLVRTLRVRRSWRLPRYAVLALDLLGAVALVAYAVRTYMAYQQAYPLLVHLPFSVPFTVQEAQSHLAAYVAPYQQAGWIFVGITAVLLGVSAIAGAKRSGVADTRG